MTYTKKQYQLKECNAWSKKHSFDNSRFATEYNQVNENYRKKDEHDTPKEKRALKDDHLMQKRAGSHSHLEQVVNSSKTITHKLCMISSFLRQALHSVDRIGT
ncbi:hypothetical protein ACOSQ2_026817 [Xanthoceras sorbifolium]